MCCRTTRFTAAADSAKSESSRDELFLKRMDDNESKIYLSRQFYNKNMQKGYLLFNPGTSFKLSSVVVVQPGVIQNITCRKPLLWSLHQKLHDQVLRLGGDGGPVPLREVEEPFLNSLEKIELALIAGSARSPIAIADTTTVSAEWWVSAEQDVHHNSQAPKVASLVIFEVVLCVIDESLHNFWSHELCRTDRSQQQLERD